MTVSHGPVLSFLVLWAAPFSGVSLETARWGGFVEAFDLLVGPIAVVVLSICTGR